MAAKVDLEKLDFDELKTLAKDIEKAIKKRGSDNLKKAREAAEAAAKEYGFSLDEVTGLKAPRQNAKSPEAKYRNPDDPKQTWSGRGRQPHWYKDAIARGRSPEKLSA
jgi:DNA-binding protein H-NS